ncbi:MAG: BamA/TamA family outer membrane protein [Saprospiraceae bacterium]|nr:BamA/TamA family outer membrane protein [Saprospiraceae bacterium]
MRNNIRFVYSDSVPDKSILRYELQTQLQQKPNDRTFIFFKPRLWFYYRQQEKGDTTEFDKFIQSKLVEPPSIYDTLATQTTVTAMKELLFNRGYLTPEVWYTDTVRNRKVSVTYFVKPNKQFRVESYELQAPDSTVQTYLDENIENTYLKPGAAVSNSNLYNEKLRILNDLQEQGFSNLSLGNFSPLEAFDTTDAAVRMRLRLLPGQDGRFNQKYVGSVKVFNRFDLSSAQDTTLLTIDSIKFLNFGSKNRINPERLINYIKLKPGDLYRREDLTLTRTQLQLPAIQFADISTFPRQDGSNKVDFQIDLLPAKRIETSAEFELNRTTVSSESFIGLGTNLGLVNNNFLGGSERFSNILDLNFEVDPQLKGFFNAVNFNFSNTLEIPRYADYLGLYNALKRARFFSPEKYERIRSNGTSVINLTYEYVDLFNFFNYHSLTAEYGFRSIITSTVTRKKLQVVHPSITYFNPTIRAQFDSLYSEETFARKSFAPQLFTSFLFNKLNYTIERLQSTRGLSSAFIASVEVSGTEIYLANLIANGLRTPFRIGDRTFAQFAKLEVDGRLYKQLVGEQALAFRANFGIGTPFGTSNVIPFVRQFYLGGPLSMRAWRIRELGPGSYQDSTATRRGNNPFFQTGDLKILLNAEYRFDIFWRIEGAFFLDAGNIWTIRKDERQGSVFSKNFIRQIALGSGAGMRFDADYFKIILDVGLKVRNPFPNESGSYSALRNSPPLNEVINWNFAINYPF